MTSSQPHSLCGVTVRLIFSGLGVDPSVISNVLQVKPTEAIAQEWGGHFDLRLPPDPIVAEASERTYDEWYRFLLAKSEKFEELSKLGYSGYLDFEISEDYRNAAFVGADLAELIGCLRLGINAWFKPKQPQVAQEECNSVLVVPQPDSYYHESDEEAFFRWLTNVEDVSSISVQPGWSGDISLKLKRPFLSDESLRSLIALLSRYELDMSSLKSQLNETNAHWFGDRESYWYKRVFHKKKPKR